MSDIVLLLDDPLFTGIGGASSDVPDPFPIAIAGHAYYVDWEKFTRQTLSPFREARDSNALPGEGSLNPLSSWKRNRDDWSLGAGQTWADRALEPFNTRIELEPRQFRASKGIDPWTLGQFTLHPDTEVAVSSASTNFKMVVLGGFIYYIDGTAIKRTNNPDAGSPTVSTITGTSGTVQDITTDGALLYISTSVGVYTSDPAGTSATVMGGAAATYKPTSLLWTNGWLFGVVANVISEIRAAGTVNMVFTHLNANFTFSSITGTPGQTYFSGQSTDVNEIYRVGVKSDGSLGPGIFSGSLPRGEFMRSMGYYGSFLQLGTTKGFRIAAIEGDGTLSIAPLISTSNEVKCCVPEGQYVWFGWTNYDSVSTGLGRIDLSQFSDLNNLFPAWATDIMYTGQGAVLSVVRFNNKTYFAVSGIGIVRQHATNKVANGTIQLGRYRFGTYEPKVLLGIEAATDPLTGSTDGTIHFSVATDRNDTTGLGIRVSGDAGTGVGQVYGVGAIVDSHDWFEPVIQLDRGSAGAAPIVRRVTLRGLPVPKIIEQFTLPVIMSATVNLEAGEGQEAPYDTAAEYAFLKGLVAASAPVMFQFLKEQILVTVREAGWTEVFGITPDRMGLEGKIMVTLITAEM